MRASEVMEVNARTRRGATKAKELHHVEITPAENGGHTVAHHFKYEGGEYHEPEEHVFGKGEHEKMLAHVANALKLPEPAEEEEEEGEEATGAAH